jgi:hypothetical protein
VLASGTLVAIFPLWAPSRTMYGSIGLGVALAGVLSAAGPALLAALVAVKLVAFALSPVPARMVAVNPDESGAFTDFGKIARLQLLMRDVRGTLQHRFHQLPRGSGIASQNIPWASEYAFGGSKALQVWYRDTTLWWIRAGEFRRRPELNVTTVVEYEEKSTPQVALVEPEALRAEWRAIDLFNQRHDLPAALREIAWAESAQADSGARTFRGSLVGIRALCSLGQGNTDAAEREAQQGLALWPASVQALVVLAGVEAARGDFDSAEAMLEALAVKYPQESSVRTMLSSIRSTRARTAPR